MTIEQKKAAFCRRVKAVQSLQAVEASGQGAFQNSLRYQERVGSPLSGVREPVAQGAPEEKTGQPLEFTALPAEAVSGS